MILPTQETNWMLPFPLCRLDPGCRFEVPPGNDCPGPGSEKRGNACWTNGSRSWTAFCSAVPTTAAAIFSMIPTTVWTCCRWRALWNPLFLVLLEAEEVPMLDWILDWMLDWRGVLEEESPMWMRRKHPKCLHHKDLDFIGLPQPPRPPRNMKLDNVF